MKNQTEPSEAARQYAAAYVAHYSEHNLTAALQLYMRLMAAHPNAREADYSRLQIQNIVTAVVPRQELLDAQIELVLALLKHDRRHDAKRIPVTPLDSGRPRSNGKMVS